MDETVKIISKHKEIKFVSEDGLYVIEDEECKFKIYNINKNADSFIEPGIDRFISHSKPISCFSILKNIIVTGSLDNLINIWSIDESLKLLKTLRYHMNPILTVHVFEKTVPVWPHGITKHILMASGSADWKIILWDINPHKMCDIAIFIGHTGNVNSICTIGNKLISGSSDKTVKVWNINTGYCIYTFSDHVKPVILVSANDNFIISGSDDKTIRIWDIYKKVCVNIINESMSGCTIKQLITRNNKIIVGYGNGTIKMWNGINGKCIHTLFGHKTSISSICEKNGMLISGSKDGTILVRNYITDDDLNVNGVIRIRSYGVKNTNCNLHLFLCIFTLIFNK